MKHFGWKLWVGLLLISLSAVFYTIHYLIFRDPHHIFLYMLHHIAFIPLEVLFVTLIIERLLHEREKQAILKKLNMLIGSFYSEAGTALIRYFSGFTTDISHAGSDLVIKADWADRDFLNAKKAVMSSEPEIDARKGSLDELRVFLETKRSFLLSLLANPNMLEHDSFTDLLWAVFHLAEELSARKTLEGLPNTDYEHLSGDIKRVYKQLFSEWLAYMQHLKSDYPYLFSLAIRTNPMSPDASPVVR
ncbi:MAG: hypothetical protein AB1632_05160 [Nitrospirota bacterium]